METKTEKRNNPESAIEFRENEAGAKLISGYAVKWDMLSHSMGYWKRFKEKFERGAFAQTLRENHQKALWSHDTSKVLGGTKNSTLKLREDETGLHFELELPNTSLGNDAYETIRRGDVDGVSFGFVMQEQNWNESDPDNIVRTIKKAKLMEVSPVAYPAYPDSQVSARADDPYQEHLKEREERNRRKKLILKSQI